MAEAAADEETTTEEVLVVDLADAAKAVAADSDRIVLHDVRMLPSQKDSALEHQDDQNHLATAHVRNALEKTNFGLLIFY